jgi:predicted regulator of Ras-like GTPase activity (Roadblock/LC7/MglB family)
MKETLLHINSIDGVIGSALFSPSGELLADVFPPLIDGASLKQAASLTRECTNGLQISENLDLLDFRYSEGRILIKAFPEATLFLLCANSINLKILLISLNLAVKKLGAKFPRKAPSAAIPAAVNGISDDGLLRMSVSRLANKEVSDSFDSLGIIALSQPTSQYISSFFKVPLKKLTLVNEAAGISGTFPVMVMKDMDPQYDGTVVVGTVIEKKLKVNDGDKVVISLG